MRIAVVKSKWPCNIPNIGDKNDRIWGYATLAVILIFVILNTAEEEM